MTPPIWPDEDGRPRPTYPCPRPGCGREVAGRFRGFRLEHLKHVGWQAYRVESYVNWCGHGQEVIPVPLADGRVTFVPVLGRFGSVARDDPTRPTKQMTRAQVQALFEELNQRHFAGALPPYQVTRYRVLKGPSGSPLTAGCNHARQILGIGVGLTGEALRKYLLHEMCHIEVRGEAQHHGPRWLACLRRVALTEPVLSQEVHEYENGIPGYFPGMEVEQVLRSEIRSLARKHHRRRWPTMRRILAFKVDHDEAVFDAAFPWAAAARREAAARARWSGQAFPPLRGGVDDGWRLLRAPRLRSRAPGVW